MRLEKLLKMQRELDGRIVREKGLEGQDLVANTFVALITELGEFANEGRWFKHWSNDREPRTCKEVANCPYCAGTGLTIPESEETPDCWKCGGDGTLYSNPLLEEYVDGVHFFLSIAIQKEWEDALFGVELDEGEFEGGLSGVYLEMIYFLSKAQMEVYSEREDNGFINAVGFPKNQYWFRTAWALFLDIGINGFGLTLKEIEHAYISKNQTNHMRQDNGY